MVWYICSAAGGTGKTGLACALAETIAEKTVKTGKPPILLDAAGGLNACRERLSAEGAVLCLADVLLGQAELEEALYNCGVPGLRLAVASFEGPPGVMEYAPLLSRLGELCDAVIVDTGTGEEGPDPEFLQAGDRVLMLCAPDETGLRQAARRLFLLEGGGARCDLIVNFAPPERRAQDKISALAEEITGRRPLLFIQQQNRTDGRGIRKTLCRAAESLFSASAFS
ncbi:MAG: hypothetical protein K5746_03530 [Clostridiales bacterium]|nr:hypothetical protein [Clostridiales bacterium]